MKPTTPKRISSQYRLGRPVLAALLLALLAVTGCGEATNPTGNTAGTAADYEERRFQFVRSGKLILRVDTQLGVVWMVEETGDGGWAMLGATPEDEGEPNWNGRYALFSLKPTKLGGPARLLRADRATGRAWLALAEESTRWTSVPEGPDPELGAKSEGSGNASGGGEGEDGPISLIVIPKETIESSPGNESDKVAVVIQALEKEGLALEIKVWAAKQLAVFSPNAAVPPLLKALESEHPEVVVAAIGSLKTIGRPSTISNVMALRQHPDPRVREAVEATVVPAN